MADLPVDKWLAHQNRQRHRKLINHFNTGHSCVETAITDLENGNFGVAIKRLRESMQQILLARNIVNRTTYG